LQGSSVRRDLPLCQRTRLSATKCVRLVFRCIPCWLQRVAQKVRFGRKSGALAPFLGRCAHACELRLTDQVPRKSAIDDPEHVRHFLGPRRQQLSQRNRQGQHPLLDRRPRQHLVDQERRRVCHPSTPRSLGKSPRPCSCTRRASTPGRIRTSLEENPCAGKSLFTDDSNSASTYRSRDLSSVAHRSRNFG
jgi:hypothetical protein